MKVIALLIGIIFLAPTLLALEKPGESWQSGVLVQCQSDPCIEGEPAEWTVGIKNQKNLPFTVSAVFIKDTDGLPVASEPNAQRAVVGLSEEVFRIQAMAPAPTRSATLYYELCFFIAGQETCESPPRTLTIYPLSEVECKDNSQCAQEEYCTNYQCAPLACERSEDHQCIEEKKPPLLGIAAAGATVALLATLYLRFRERKNKPSPAATHHSQEEDPKSL
jgi:hypothetical protein